MSLAKKIIDECNAILNEEDMNQAPADAPAENNAPAPDEKNAEMEAAYQRASQEIEDIMA